jgi:1-acyl-sn-glycerol-3-phosphate acyltransferase
MDERGRHSDIDCVDQGVGRSGVARVSLLAQRNLTVARKAKAVGVTKSVQSDPRSRPKPFTFRPPRPNRLVIACCKLILPLVIRRKLKVTEIEIGEDDLAKLKALRRKRCLLMPSHSGGLEPYIILHLSKLLGDYYNYLAAMEPFEESPVTGWLMQRLGAYSVIRSTADRPSFQMTKQLLVDARRWLVVFPEGQTVWQNDTVMPFQQGVVQLAFKAYEAAVKQDEEASLFCVPISIKYAYLEEMREEREASLARLESRLFRCDRAAPRSSYERLRRIGAAVLGANEKSHNVSPEEDASLDDRIQLMKETIVRRIELQLELTPRADQSLLDRTRALFNAVDRIVLEEPEASEYEQKLISERQQATRVLYDDLWRVLQLIAIYDGYVSESMTVERFMDVLCVLEMEVLGKRMIWGPRKAMVKVGDPVDLKDHFSSYQTNRRGVIQEVTLDVESQVRQMLSALADRARLTSVEQSPFGDGPDGRLP